MYLRETDSVKDIRKKVSKLKMINDDLIRLIYEDRLLVQGTVQSLGIKKETTIDVDYKANIYEDKTLFI